MKLRTVGDLREYLSQNSLSPEKLSGLCGISNMTVRRWLKNEATSPLPSKYWPIFDHSFAKSPDASLAQTFQFGDGFPDLEKHVFDLGSSLSASANIESEFVEKSKDESIAKGLIDKVKLLFSLVKSDQITHYQRTLVLGAIVYFISPFDLVPDPTPIMGYLDDYAVVTMVLASIGQGLSRKSSA